MINSLKGYFDTNNYSIISFIPDVLRNLTYKYKEVDDLNFIEVVRCNIVDYKPIFFQDISLAIKSFENLSLLNDLLYVFGGSRVDLIIDCNDYEPLK